MAGASVAFAKPLTEGDAPIKGKTIPALVATQPLFAPIEGLPKQAWANQPCAACHKWTKPALCDQAKFYVTEAAPGAKLKQYPLGGDFKLTLKAWGAAGCPQIADRIPFIGLQVSLPGMGSCCNHHRK